MNRRKLPRRLSPTQIYHSRFATEKRTRWKNPKAHCCSRWANCLPICRWPNSGGQNPASNWLPVNWEWSSRERCSRTRQISVFQTSRVPSSTPARGQRKRELAFQFPKTVLPKAICSHPFKSQKIFQTHKRYAPGRCPKYPLKRGDGDGTTRERYFPAKSFGFTAIVDGGKSAGFDPRFLLGVLLMSNSSLPPLTRSVCRTQTRD